MAQSVRPNVHYTSTCEEIYTFRPDGLMLTCVFSKNHPWSGELHTYSYETDDVEKYDGVLSRRPAISGVYVTFEKDHRKHGICRYYNGRRAADDLIYVTVCHD